MRVLFTTWSSPSHFFPLVPLARSMRAAGHDVAVAAPPSCRSDVVAAGLRHLRAGRDLDVSATSTRGELAAWHLQRRWPPAWPVHSERLSEEQHAVNRALGTKQVMAAATMLPDLRAHAAGVDLVVHDAVSWAGRVVARELGVPSVSHMWGSAAVLRLERDRLGHELLPGYRDLFTDAGMDPADDSNLWLDPCPPSLRVPSADVRASIRFVPYNGPQASGAPLPAPSGRPRVCLTWGVTASKLAPGTLPPLLLRTVEALAGLDVEVLLAAPPALAPLLVGLPPSVHAVLGTPLRRILQSCAAVVHQGGGGTTMTTAHAGLPQLVISPRPEQMLTGDQLVARGAGRHRVANELTGPDSADLIREDVTALLTRPSYRTAAAEVAREMAAMPAVEDVAQGLELLALGQPVAG